MENNCFNITKKDFPQFWVISFYRGGIGSFPCNEEEVKQLINKYKIVIKNWFSTPFIDPMSFNHLGGYKIVAKLFFRKGSNYKGMIYCQSEEAGKKLLKSISSQ